ncbi:MAG: helix-turn-helix transcriptional regulator [Oscillibacter sp.]
MFADKIRVLRKEKKLTQAEVAKEVGLSARGYQDLSWAPSRALIICSTSRTSTMCPWTG